MHGRIVRNEKCSEKRIDIPLHMHGTSAGNLGAGTVHVHFRSRLFFGAGLVAGGLLDGVHEQLHSTSVAGFLQDVGLPASPVACRADARMPAGCSCMWSAPARQADMSPQEPGFGRLHVRR